MGATAKIGMVGDECVALVNLIGAVVSQNSRRASRERAHVKRQNDMLGDDFSLPI